MAVATAVAVVGTAYAANRASSAAKDQARAAGRAADASIAEQQRQFDIIQEQQRPYREVGVNALNQLSQLYGLNPTNGQSGGAPDYSAFLNSPDYQFALQQGSQAVDRSAAARGMLNSGNTLAAAQQFGQGLASQQLGNYRNSLMGLAGIGQGAANTVSNAALNAGQTNSNTLLQTGIAQGNARASGAIGQANAITGGLNQLGMIAGYGGFGQQQVRPYGGLGAGGGMMNTGYNPRNGAGLMVA